MVVKVLELVGHSRKDWSDAVNQAVQEASRTVDNITGVEIQNMTAEVDNGRCSQYRANVRVAFIVDSERQEQAQRDQHQRDQHQEQRPQHQEQPHG